MMSCIFCDFSKLFRVPGSIAAFFIYLFFIVDLISSVVVHLKKNQTSGQSGSRLEWSVFYKESHVLQLLRCYMCLYGSSLCLCFCSGGQLAEILGLFVAYDRERGSETA